MPTKKRKVLKGVAQGNAWSVCQYKIRKASGWIAIERELDWMIFTVCVGPDEANVAVPNMELPYETLIEAERLLNFAQTTKDRPPLRRATIVSKLLRDLMRKRYGAATEFGVLLRKLFEKTNLEEE